jgi:hypothetical protein
MSGIRYASTIWAMTRRNGEYCHFSVSHQIGAGGAKDALFRPRNSRACSIQQVEVSADGWRRAFAEAARTAAVEVYRDRLEADVGLWSQCSAQWGAGPGTRSASARIIRDGFEKRADLNQKLEGVMSALCEEIVVSLLERLSNESAGELPADIRPANIRPFAHRVPA